MAASERRTLRSKTLSGNCKPFKNDWNYIETILNMLKLNCRPLACTSFKAFQKTKKGLELVFPVHFLFRFWREVFFLLYSINWPNFIAWLPLLHEILGNMCIVIVCQPVCEVINFEINHIFLIKPFFSKWPKISDKKLNLSRTKRAFKVK